LSTRTGRPSKAGSDAFRVVPARPHHVEALPAIERAAAHLFSEEDLAPHLRDQCTALEDLALAARERRLWVALDGDTPIGFALADTLDGLLHLEELDVHPDHARRGIGRRLVETVLSAARADGSPAATLTTFRHLPWNAPFYRSCGFRELDEHQLGPDLKETFEQEVASGLEREKRVAMRCDL
jgi:GNAT superfamily N-acetyltransferase